MRELDQCVRNLLIHGRYLPPAPSASRDRLEPLFSRMRAGEATLDEVASAYSRWVYSQTGSYVGAARTLGVDRRTVKDRIQPPNASE